MYKHASFLLVRNQGSLSISNVGKELRLFVSHFLKEFDPGSERTLAGCLKHASRAAARVFTPGGERRTGA